MGECLVRGTQSIHRAFLVLRILAARGEFGWPLGELAVACELDRGTVHRILSGLMQEGSVQQRKDNRHYCVGPYIFELGLAVVGYTRFQSACRSLLEPIARKLECIAWFLLRSGDEYVCLVREGTRESSGMMIRLGTRRHLISSVGGVAILQALPSGEARRIIARNIEQEIASHGQVRVKGLARMRTRSSKYGFGVNFGDVAAGIHAFADCVRSPSGVVLGAVGLTSTAEAFPEGRVDEMRTILRALVDELELIGSKCLSDRHFA